MEELPVEEIKRIHTLLLEDDKKRDRSQFVYAFDVLKKNWIVPYSIWPIPNSDVLKILDGKVDYNELLFEDQNEIEKGILFEDQRQLVEQHVLGGKILCEANNYRPCFQEKCPLFRAKSTKQGGKYGICSEFKIAFTK